MSDTPRTDSRRGFHGWYTAVDAEFSEKLERELNAANVEIERLTAKVAQLYEGAEEAKQRIKRLEEENNELRAEEARLLNTNGELERRIKRLEEAVDAYRTAYTPDGHVAPHDCFATGPMTGNPIQDLIACPGCWAERKAKEANL